MPKKEKQWAWSLNNKRVTLSEDAPFFTTDTAAWLRFDLTGEEKPESAVITLYNLDDKSVIDEPAEVNNDRVSYHMRPDIIRHAGRWRVQLIVVINGEDYTSPQISFPVDGHILDSREERLIIFDSIDEYVARAQAFIDVAEAEETKRIEAEDERKEFYEGFSGRLNAHEIKIASNQRTIRTVEDNLSSVNVNQEAKQTISTNAKIASLPVNAGNGALDATLKGFTATNLVRNGDFSEGLTGWNYSFGQTATVSNNVLTSVVDTGSSVGIVAQDTGASISIGDRVYVLIRSRVNNSESTELSHYFNGSNTAFASNAKRISDVLNPVINAWYLTQEIITIPPDVTGTLRVGLRHRYQTAEGALPGNAMEVDYVQAINLTQTFGAGNEPTKEQCDIIFDTYFDGTKSFTPGRVRSTSAYEPYTETVQYVKPVKLNRLPNGVADEITADGDFIQRVGEQVIDGTEVYEQLAEPIVHKNVTTGNLIAHPKGTVYFEQYQADAGVYAGGLTTTNTSHAIKSLESLSVVDFMTGNEVELDVSKAVITGNSFTHPDLSDGDLVFLTYEFNAPGPNGNKSLSFYDSRYTIKDAVTGQFYKWKVSVENGVPKLEVEGV